ncbi:hypothetical protein [Indioceanicola profundi]|uniref:hypothetical protein n=1 Tax=Indioceanicola profundi TaxID=2220096 RepID=UPI0013C50468|nr:hypothetical protein [Indioceanicola profundi]
MANPGAPPSGTRGGGTGVDGCWMGAGALPEGGVGPAGNGMVTTGALGWPGGVEMVPPTTGPAGWPVGAFGGAGSVSGASGG